MKITTLYLKMRYNPLLKTGSRHSDDSLKALYTSKKRPSFS